MFLCKNECADLNSECSVWYTSLASFPDVSRCVCIQPDYYYDQFKCVLKLKQGELCSDSSQCILNAYCYNAPGDLGSKCWCDNHFYYDSNAHCKMKKSFNSTCSFDNQCNFKENGLKCFQGKCGCDLKPEFWDSSLKKCVALKLYSQSCTQNFECSQNMICDYPYNGGSKKICRCMFNKYYDELTGACKNYKPYEALCNYRVECGDGAQCGQISGDTQSRCHCLQISYYKNELGCYSKKDLGSQCSFDYQCYDYLGHYCKNFKCSCPDTQFNIPNTSACEWLKRSKDSCFNNDNYCASGKCQKYNSNGFFAYKCN